MADRRPQTSQEELANAATHGAGLVLSVAGCPVLVLTALRHGDVQQVVACSIFAATLVLLYTTSTIYHALPISAGKRRVRVADHVAIYLLIAGSYTPFALGVLRGTWGWTVFGLTWALAAVGILHKTLLGFRFPRLSTWMYLGMGWLAVAMIRPLSRTLPAAGLAWLVAGGLCYTVGVIFYVRSHQPYRHAVWHLFVLAGSGCHYAAVLGYATGAPR